jgi:hypothetical protein
MAFLISMLQLCAALLFLVAMFILLMLLLFSIKAVLIVAFKQNGTCSKCDSRMNWIWQEKSRDFSHEDYVHTMTFRKCLRCGHKETIGHTGGFHDHWTDPVTGERREGTLEPK